MPGPTSATAVAADRVARRPAALGWATRRPTAAAAIIYLVLSVVMFAPGLAPGRTLSASDYLWTATPWDSSRPADVPQLGSNREQTDAVVLFQPSLQLTRGALPDIPLWDPYTLSGRPFLADPQSAIFTPFSVPAYVLPFWKSLAVIAILKIFVAALGAFLLARTLGMRFGGALLTGLVFGFSLWSVTWVSWTTMSVWAFLPWICLFSELCVRRPAPLPWAGLAAAVGLQFLGGHPSSSFQVLVFLTLFWGVRTVASPRLRHRLGLRLFTFGSALAVGTALAAVMLIPFVELLARSADLESRSAISDLLHQPPRYLLAIFLHDYWGRGPTAIEFASSLEEHAYYVAALPLMLAASAVVVRASRERIAVLGVGAVALMVATGLPPFYDLIVGLPGFAASNNGRIAVITVLCLAVLAGWGLDDLTGTRLPAGRPRRILAVALLLLVVPVAIVAGAGYINVDALGEAFRVAWGFVTPSSELASSAGMGLAGLTKFASLLEWLVVASAAVVLLFLRLRGRLGASLFVALTALLVAADLFKAGMGYNPGIPVSHAEQPATGAIRFLQSQHPARFAGLEPRAPVTLAAPLAPDVAMRYRLQDARGYVVPYEGRYFEFWRRAVASDSACYFLFCTYLADNRPEALRALGLLGVGFLMENRRDSRLRRLSVAYDGSDARIYRNPDSLPRAFLVGRQVVASDGEAALSAVMSPGFHARSEAVTEERIAGLAQRGGERDASAGRARIAHYGRERVVVETTARRRSLLVLTDNWYPGWNATVDGEPAEVHRVNYLTRGVTVPAGAHRVELSFEPASWRVGWMVSSLALLVIVGVAALGWRRRRPQPAHGASA